MSNTNNSISNILPGSLPKNSAESGKNASLKAIDIKSLADVNPRNIYWLWDNRIPKGCVTILEGDGGIGKSFILISLACALTTGRALPGQEPVTPINVMLLSLEDDPEAVLRKRVDANNGEPSKIFFLDQTFPLKTENLKTLEQKLIEKNIGLLCIDPIVGYFDSGKDMNKSTDVRQLMNDLHQLAKRLDIAVLCVRHWNKSKDVSVGQRGSGSVDFRNAARSVLSVIKGDNGKCYLGISKANYAVQAGTLVFSLQRSPDKDKESLLIWEGEAEQNISDIMAEQDQLSSEGKSQISEAVDFLQKILSDGVVRASEINRSAAELGISGTTLKRARKQLGVLATQMPSQKGWFLSLPNTTGPEGQGTRHPIDDPLGYSEPEVERQLGLL